MTKKSIRPNIHGPIQDGYPLMIMLGTTCLLLLGGEINHLFILLITIRLVFEEVTRFIKKFVQHAILLKCHTDI